LFKCGAEDAVFEMRSEQLLICSGSAVPAPRSALESAIFLDERANAMAGFDQTFGT
jgi:hypothetical protein